MRRAFGNLIFERCTTEEVKLSGAGSLLKTRTDGRRRGLKTEWSLEKLLKRVPKVQCSDAESLRQKDRVKKDTEEKTLDLFDKTSNHSLYFTIDGKWFYTKFSGVDVRYDFDRHIDFVDGKDVEIIPDEDYADLTKEEKKKYDEKKLCRTMGIGMSIIAILALIMGVLENILPAFFVYIALGIIVVDVVVIIILENTLCKK